MAKEFNLPVAPSPQDVIETEDGFDFHYYEVETTKKKYFINQQDYDRITGAIAQNLNLVRIGEDIVNVKQIKFIEKANKHLQMTKIEMEGRKACEVLDVERIKKFKQLIGL